MRPNTFDSNKIQKTVINGLASATKSALRVSMASHTRQKWSRFFCFEIFLSELGTLFSRRGFQYSSRDLFYSIWDVLIQVEFFFFMSRFLSQVENFSSRWDFYRKSRIFSLVEIFIASREFFLSSRILSQFEIFFPCLLYTSPSPRDA